MKRKIHVLLAFLLFTTLSYAQLQIPMGLPPQSTTYSPQVRGYWFIAPTCFTITGLEVPTDASSSEQNIAVIRFDTVPPLYPDTAQGYTVLYLTQNNAASGIIAVDIPVNEGQVIGILGNRGDNNSYAPAPYTSAIGSFPVTLSRLGMQYTLSTTAPKEMWTEAAANLSRVIMYYDTVSTVTLNATWQGGFNYSFTNGSGASSLSVYDYGDGSPLDTAYNPTHTFPTFGTYNVCSYVTGNCVSDTGCTTIVICPTPALASFTEAINYPTVDFTDQSLNTVTWAWDFGDGNTSSSQNPSHTYATFGRYTVCLTATDVCGGQHTVCRDISVCPALIPITLGSDTAACGNAIIGLSGYSSYIWNNGATTAQINITTSGTYSIEVVDAAGCMGRDTLNVTIHPLPNVSLGTNIVQCGGTVQIGVSPVTGSTYNWSTGGTTASISVGVSGNYSLDVTDSLGCTDSDDIDVTINPVPAVNLGNDYVGCQGFVSFSGPSGMSTYNWNTGSTSQSVLINATGTYWLIAANSFGCSDTDTVSVTMYPFISYVETQTLLCVFDGPITLTPGSPAGGTYSGPGVTGNTFDPAAAGIGNKNIIYTYTDTAGCIGRDTSVITVNSCTGIEQLGGTNVSVYPNPGNGVFTVELGVTPDLVVVTDLAGREVYRGVPSDRKFAVDLSTGQAGAYSLSIRYQEESATIPLMIVK